MIEPEPCKCGHPESDHMSNEGECVYGWDGDWQALDDEERNAPACPCDRYETR